MKITKPNSLAQTIDALNEMFFYETPLSGSHKEEVAKWICGRQGLPGSYAGMFAPTPKDFKEGIRLFTGERIWTRAATAHIMGEEACRALIELNVRLPDVRNALGRATRGMLERITCAEDKMSRRGFYCCGICTAALWRNLAVGGLDTPKMRLAAGLKILKKHRDGKGGWRRFPFHYTLLALSEIDLPAVADELRYAAPICERYLKYIKTADKFARRRRDLSERILIRC